jgi:4-diphosphocytidyl-2C-methyl-D-erythritol kinase
MTYVEATTSAPLKLQRYLVLSATRTEIEQELNKLAEKGYKPILMSGTGGGTINLILDRGEG